MHNLVTVCFTTVKVIRKLSICILILNDKQSSFIFSVSIHQRDIQILAIEMLQIKHGQSREIVIVIFTQVIRDKNYRINRDFMIPSVNTVHHDSENISN